MDLSRAQWSRVGLTLAIALSAASARAQEPAPPEPAAAPPVAPAANASGSGSANGNVSGSANGNANANGNAGANANGNANAAPASNPSGSTAAAATSAGASPDTGHFEFGSYGRVRAASDLRGGTGRQANVITHGSRIDEESYAELELRREDTFKDDIHTKVVATLALFPPFFHFSGNATQSIALRNLYAQATYGDWTMWAGSRMYRGDDIYLLDWWPLDNQNTVGGGVGTRLASDTTIAAHVGMNRLDSDRYQYQSIPVVAPFGFGSTTVALLDRPRVVESLKITQFIRNGGGRHPLASDKAGFKVVLYGEAHELAAGVYQDDTNPTVPQQRPLPADSGFLVGTELAYWTGERDTFVQLFMRHARGVAAYDPLAVPLTFANDKTTSGSTESLIALGGNWENGPVGLLVGGYVRWFRDGDPSPTSTQKYDEGTLVARPQIYIGEHWGVAVEGSFQERRYAWLDPQTNAPLTASMWRAGIIPYFSPAGRGSYKRPQLRLLYAASYRSDGARELYPQEDTFAQRKVEHFLGIGAEWWFNSSSYP